MASWNPRLAASGKSSIVKRVAGWGKWAVSNAHEPGPGGSKEGVGSRPWGTATDYAQRSTASARRSHHEAPRMTTPSTPVALAQARDARTFGGKAATLAVASGAGLPVPEGLALAWPLVDATAAGDPDAVGALDAVASSLGPSLAVRSSALDEDSQAASFAGQHLSLLNVGPSALGDAVGAVARSARSDGALAYRRRLGVTGRARTGVVIQAMIDADVAGVLFDVNPATGADELVIEAAWGLGEAVVGGLVTPDMFRLSVEGAILERRAGDKDLEVVAAPGGGTQERPAAPGRAGAMCLDDGRLARLHRLAIACREVFGGAQDIEWAFAHGGLWLLQRRAVTREAGRDEGRGDGTVKGGVGRRPR